MRNCHHTKDNIYIVVHFVHAHDVVRSTIVIQSDQHKLVYKLQLHATRDTEPTCT